MKNMWNKFQQYKKTILVTFFNRYQGLILFLMLLAIYYK